MKGYSVPVLASVKIKGKKHFLGFVDDWIDILEGNNQNCSSYEEAGKLVSAYLHAMESVSTGHIVVTGAGNVRELERFGEELHKACLLYTSFCDGKRNVKCNAFNYASICSK